MQAIKRQSLKRIPSLQKQLVFLNSPFQSKQTESHSCDHTYSKIHTAALQFNSSFTSQRLSKAPSLLFELEVEEESHLTVSAQNQNNGLACLRSILFQEEDDFETQVQRALRRVFQHLNLQHQQVGLLQIAESLEYHYGLKVVIRESLDKIRHTFLVVSKAADYGSKEVVIDTNFKQQFTCTYCSTNEYQQIIDSIDPVLIVSIQKLTQVIKYLSEQLSDCFKQNNEIIPPWRKPENMLNRWFPQKFQDYSIEQFKVQGVSNIQEAGLGVNALMNKYDTQAITSGNLNASINAVAALNGQQYLVKNIKNTRREQIVFPQQRDKVFGIHGIKAGYEKN